MVPCRVRSRCPVPTDALGGTWADSCSQGSAGYCQYAAPPRTRARLRRSALPLASRCHRSSGLVARENVEFRLAAGPAVAVDVPSAALAALHVLVVLGR